jgi:myo-inositol-1-phosphate synthase
MRGIRVAIVGVGNCASSLVQGLSYYSAPESKGENEAHSAALGLMHPLLGGWRVGDIQVVAAFDIDARKVGRPLEEAIFANPNNTKRFFPNVPASGVTVQMGSILDGIAPHMAEFPMAQRFEPSDARPVAVERILRESGAEILVNYLPVGSEQATAHYAEACLDAGVSLVNCIPVFIVSNPLWARRFTERGIPCIGDDVKAQVGATIIHRTLARLFDERGMRIDSTYQLNTGGNTDFLNMLSRDRLASKKVSKTEAVQSQLDVPLDPQCIHIGPSDYIAFQKDNKVCFLRIEATGFGGVPMNLELRLSVEDSPNSAGVVVDAIRSCKLARDAKMAGPIEPVSAWTMKHPPRQMHDGEARLAFEEFVGEASSRIRQPAYNSESLKR